MEVIGKFILNLIADSIASLIHDIFVALLTVIMDFVSKMIVSLWDDSVVSAIVSCSSWIAMGVFAVGCILMLYDILEARSEEKAVYMSAVTKNFVSGLAFALFGPKLVHVMTKAILSLIQLLKLSDSVTNFEVTEYANSLTNLWLSPDLVVGSSLLESVICFFIVVIGSGVFIYKITLRFVQFITLIAMVPLYETSVLRGDQTAFSGWFRQAMAVGLTFFFEYFFYALAITLLMSTGIANTFLGMGCLLGMGGVSRTLDKYGLSSAGPHINKSKKKNIRIIEKNKLCLIGTNPPKRRKNDYAKVPLSTTAAKEISFVVVDSPGIDSDCHFGGSNILPYFFGTDGSDAIYCHWCGAGGF